MAGRGPAPADQKRRRNKPEGVDELLPFTGKAPALPKTYRAITYRTNKDGELEQRVKQQPFLKATKDWYEAWATSPMASKFAATDWNRLRMVIAPLFDRYQRLPSKDIAAELRLQESLLGGTAMDRQRLRWGLPASDEPTRTPARQRGGSTKPDRRARLSVVK